MNNNARYDRSTNFLELEVNVPRTIGILRDDHLEGLSSGSSAILESFHNVAFLRTDGARSSPPPCSKLPEQNVCCTVVTGTLPPCFTEKRNVEKSSITVPGSDFF